MATKKIAITLEENLLDKVNFLVSEGLYPSRSKLIQESLKEKMSNWKRKRLMTELSKLNPKEEQSIADEDISAGNEIWDKY